LAEIKATRKVGTKKKQELSLPLVSESKEGSRVKLVLDDDEESSIKWLEALSLLADLIDYYCVLGGHPEKLPEMLTHYRLLQRFGSDHTFTYESLIEYDAHIRSRKEGQGQNLSWRFDTTTRHVILKDYTPKDKAKKKSGKGKPNPNKTCFDWAQGKTCKYGDDCKWNHECESCKVKKPAPHDIEKCPNKSELKPKKKRT